MRNRICEFKDVLHTTARALRLAGQLENVQPETTPDRRYKS